jgi:serine protease Do
MRSGCSGALIAQFSRDLATVVRSVLPAVVALSGTSGDYVCSGSGFIIDRAGHIVTNAHVVEDLRSPVDATLHGGAQQPASIVGKDPLTDLALLRLERAPRHHLTLRRKPAACGEMCLALGNPLGRYPESVTLGIVSGVARTVYQEIGRPIYGSIQTDCAVSAGNSGGPLVDVQGRVIGVSVRKDRQADNVGFAIPAETVREVVAELMASGRVRRASLGVTVRKGSVSIGGRTVEGVEVVDAPSTRSPGFRRGDLIVRIARTKVKDVTDVVRMLGGDRIGQSTTVELVRHGKRRTLVVRPRELRTPESTNP